MKDKTTAGLLAIFLGGLGVHKFYLGRMIQGIIYLVFCWTTIPAVIGLIEGIIYLTMDKNAFDFKYNPHAVMARGGQGVSQNVHQTFNLSNQVETPQKGDTLAELEKLNSLYQSGAITEDEFYEMKQRLLNKLRNE